MPFANVLELANAVADNGRNWQSFVFKTAGVAGGAGRWVDASMAAGIPVFNAYPGAPLEATQLVGGGNRGIYTGPAIAAGQTKHIFAMSLATTAAAVPLHAMLADYLLFYALVDGDSTDAQTLTNGVMLPRYTSGEGVQCFVVCTTPMAASATATISYTNSAGVSGRTSTFGLAQATVVGTLANTANATNGVGAVSPFVPLASGDLGIRSIESVTLATPAGGFLALVLARPLASLQLREAATMAEKIMFPQNANAPEVRTGAYLNFLMNNATASSYANLHGFVQFAWS